MKRLLLLFVATILSYVGWSQTVNVYLKNGTYHLKNMMSIGFEGETQSQDDYSIVGRWEVVYCRYLEDGCDWNTDKAIGTIVEFFNNGQVSFNGKTKIWKIVNTRLQLYDSKMIEDNKILLLNKEKLEIFIKGDSRTRALVKLKKVSY